MRGNPGYVVRTDKGQIGVAHHKEQLEEFKKNGKILIHLLDDDFKPLIDPDTKQQKKTLIDPNRCTPIGMYD